MLSEVLLRQVALTLHARALTSPQVRPTDEPVARSGSEDAIRVLLLGSGITSGWGVHTHGLGLVGWLQTILQERMNRAVDVEQVSATGATLAQALEVLGDRASEEWDAIVVAFGLSDAMRLTPAREWAQGLDRLLAKLDADMPRGLLVPIVLVGMPPTDSMALMTPLMSIFSRQPDRLNALTRSATERNRRTTFAPLEAMADSAAHPQGSSEAYRSWAAAIAARLIELIPHEVVRVRDVHASTERIAALPASVLLEDRNDPVRTRLTSIAERLQADADADLVLIALLSGDRLWSVADSTGRAGRSLLMPAAFCGTTLRDGFLHIRDAARDPRLSHLSAALTGQFDSYAGMAIRDASGRTVGAVCLFNGAAGGSRIRTVLSRVRDDIEGQLRQLTSPGGGRLEVRQEAHLGTTVSGSPAPIEPVAHPDPDPAPTSDAPSPPTLLGPIRRRIRLSTEGRDLAKVGTSRPVPAERDLRIQGADPLRVLLVGGEYAVGFGTEDRHDSLDGALARLLHVRTGRGVVVENRSRHLVPLEHLAGSLGPGGAHTFDLVIWTPTFVEAARLLLRSRWNAGLGLMLRRIQTTSDAAVVLVGFPSLIGSQPLAAIGRTRAAQINRLLARIASRHQRVLVAQPPSIVLKDVQTVSGAAVYQAAAVQILPAVMRLLAGDAEPEARTARRVGDGMRSARTWANRRAPRPENVRTA